MLHAIETVLNTGITIAFLLAMLGFAALIWGARDVLVVRNNGATYSLRLLMRSVSSNGERKSFDQHSDEAMSVANSH